MKDRIKKLWLIKLAYILGIGADTLWAVALFIPAVFALFVGQPDFQPDFQTRSIMYIGGTLMAGWTLLLIWAIKKPIERRVVIFLTALPVVLGMFLISLFDFLNGNTKVFWILIKCAVLMFSMILSYILAERLARQKN